MTRSIIPFINPFQEANPTLECVLRNVCASDPDKNRTFGSGGGTNGGGGAGGGEGGGMPMGRRELRMCVWYTWACSLQM